MSEIPFEYMLIALESPVGTPIDPPTHYLQLAGKVTPKITRYRPAESDGTLAEYGRSQAVRKWSEFEAAGGADVYSLPLVLNTLIKGGVSAPTHPVNGVVGILDLYANVADAETVTINAKTYEFDVINTDSTIDTAGGSWNNVTNPLTVDLAGMVGLVTVIVQGDLIRIGTEIMKCTGVAGTNYTFSRGRSGTTNAVHIDGGHIYISAAAGAPGTDLYVGLTTTLTPAVAAPALAAEINAEDAADITATSVTISGAFRAVECVATAAHALIATSETLLGALNAWRTGIVTALWTFAPDMDANDLLALTAYWGDPNVQAFQADYCQPDELTLSADAAGTDGVTESIKGQGHFPALTAPASVPAIVHSPLLMPGAMQLWIDAMTIGSTAITGRVLSAEVTIPSGLVRKNLAAGPTNDLQFSQVGRAKRHAEMKLTFEVPDLTQYSQWVAGTVLKARLRLNGPAIVAVTGTIWYYYVDVDIYGPFDALSWGENEGSNRTIELAILSEKDAGTGIDFAMRVLNNKTTL
jgi:hypothetical protein